MLVKKITPVFLAILFVFISALPVFAAESNEVHIHRTEESVKDINENYQVCLDCGEEIYRCPTCFEFYSPEADRCTLCGTKKIVSKQDKFIEECQLSFLAAVCVLLTIVGFTIRTIVVYKKEGDTDVPVCFMYLIMAGTLFLILYDKFTPIITMLRNGTLF